MNSRGIRAEPMRNVCPWDHCSHVVQFLCLDCSLIVTSIEVHSMDEWILNLDFCIVRELRYFHCNVFLKSQTPRISLNKRNECSRSIQQYMGQRVIHVNVNYQDVLAL